jgi:hypothetical protein
VIPLSSSTTRIQIRDSESTYFFTSVEYCLLALHYSLLLVSAHNVLYSSKDIALFIEMLGQDNYKPVIELLNSYNINVIFQKNYDWGDCHIIATSNRFFVTIS